MASIGEAQQFLRALSSYLLHAVGGWDEYCSQTDIQNDLSFSQLTASPSCSSAMLPRSWSSVAQAGRQLVLVFLLTYSVMIVVLNPFYVEEAVTVEDNFHTRSQRLEERGACLPFFNYF